ncbi:MAG: hypothetical protein Q8O64_18695 [Sideroxyarcus sp.]|nr:hypothetical protein [Sideroxyarcus sp.]
MQFKIKLTSPFVGFLLLLASAQAIGALPGESIVLNPNTGDYTITYWDYPNSPRKQLQQAIFVPSTKIDPLVKSTLKLRDDGVIAYTYRVTNGAISRQSLVAMRFDPVTDIVSALPLPKNEQDVDPNTMEQIIAAGMDALATPANWNGSSYTSEKGGLRISWSYAILRSVNDGLKPGNTQGGFGFTSRDIPGIGIAQLSGHSPVPGWPDEGPEGDIANEFEKIEQNDFVPRYTVVPAIAVPTPFDPAVTLERIQSHTHTWIGMPLLDATFSAQLDRYFQAAISAYRLNQPKIGKEHIQTMRELIKKEQADADREDDNDDRSEKGGHDDMNKRALIDKLAARVLDFDLKYVLKQMEREHEEGERKKKRD